jgi:hypothetical protein
LTSSGSRSTCRKIGSHGSPTQQKGGPERCCFAHTPTPFYSNRLCCDSVAEDSTLCCDLSSSSKSSQQIPTASLRSGRQRGGWCFHQALVHGIDRTADPSLSVGMTKWMVVLDWALVRAFSLLLCTGKCSEVRLFLRKSRAEAGCPVYTRSENALVGSREQQVASLRSGYFGDTICISLREQGTMQRLWVHAAACAALNEE